MNLTNQIKLFDIEYYEGPMLSLFRDDKANSFYLYKWLDIEKNGHKWLIFKTTLEHLYDYIHQDIDEKVLIKKALNGQYATVIIQSNLVYDNLKHFTKINLPNNFLPQSGVFFTPSDCPDYKMLVKFLEETAVISLQIANKAA